MPMARTKGETPNRIANGAESKRNETKRKQPFLFARFRFCFCASVSVFAFGGVCLRKKYEIPTNVEQQHLLFAFMNNGEMLKTEQRALE